MHQFDRAHATATAAATAAVVVHSFFVNSLLLPFVMQILWVMWARLAHIRSARRSRIGVAALLPVLAIAGCDPCAGVSCSTTPHVTLTGTIVNHATGVGVPNTKIDLHATDPGGYSASTSTTTDQSGVWQATVKLQTSGSSNAVVTVSAPNAPSYAATIPVDASTRDGDATVIGLWTEMPFVRQLLSVLVQGQPLGDATVHFKQMSGPTVVAAQTDATTNGSGVFELDFAGQALGRVVGVLTITKSSLPSPIVVPDLGIQLDYHFGIPRITGTIIR